MQQRFNFTYQDDNTTQSDYGQVEYTTKDIERYDLKKVCNVLNHKKYINELINQSYLSDRNNLDKHIEKIENCSHLIQPTIIEKSYPEIYVNVYYAEIKLDNKLIYVLKFGDNEIQKGIYHIDSNDISHLKYNTDIEKLLKENGKMTKVKIYKDCYFRESGYYIFEIKVVDEELKITQVFYEDNLIDEEDLSDEEDEGFYLCRENDSKIDIVVDNRFNSYLFLE